MSNARGDTDKFMTGLQITLELGSNIPVIGSMFDYYAEAVGAIAKTLDVIAWGKAETNMRLYRLAPLGNGMGSTSLNVITGYGWAKEYKEGDLNVSK